jgi:hypothetical protein
MSSCFFLIIGLVAYFLGARQTFSVNHQLNCSIVLFRISGNRVVPIWVMLIRFLSLFGISVILQSTSPTNLPWLCWAVVWVLLLVDHHRTYHAALQQ